MIDEAYNQAIKVLEKCVSDIGFKASGLDNGYREVWGRDSMISLIGALSSGDPSLKKCSRITIETLAKYQTDLGLIPNNVDVENKEPQYRAYMDGTIWYIIGIWYYYKQTRDEKFLSRYFNSVQNALKWLAYQDVDATSLISTQEASNWMDLFPIRGKVLYDNVLYYAALKSGVDMCNALNKKGAAKRFADRAKTVRSSINCVLWIHDSHTNLKDNLKDIEGKVKNIRYFEDEIIRLAEACLHLVWRPYFLAFRGFRQYGDWFDTLGNMLAIIFDVADKEQSRLIMDYAAGASIADPYPVKAVYPPIYIGDIEWRDYFKIGNLNLPNHYHNGGIWPFVGGFYITALVKVGRHKAAREVMEKLAAACYLGRQYKWEFNEWHHGVSGNPMGKKKQAWSAAMFIYAYNCVNKGKVDLSI